MASGLSRPGSFRAAASGRRRLSRMPASPEESAPDEFRRHPHPRRATAQPEEPRSRHPHRRNDRGDGAERFRQVEPRLRHAVRRRPAPLRRDIQRLRPPVPRADGPAGGRQGRRRSAGDRHRPDQPGAQLALDGRHDDGAERPPQAVVRACGAALRQADGAAGAPRLARDDLRRADGARSVRGCAACGKRHHRRRTGRAGTAPRRHLPGRAAGSDDRRRGRAVADGERLHTCPRRARGRIADRAAQAARRRRRPLPHRHDREGARDRGDRDGAQARQRSRQRLCGAGIGRGAVALLDRPALPRQRPPLCRSAAGPVLVQLRLRRLRDLPRLRPRHRRRLRPRDSGPAQDACARAPSRRSARRPGRSSRTT